ncbi:MAG: aspartate/glutamate racemase family protein [Candidatus Zeuxoniibacter abyssi]|nr:MAG: aspartate/glutamate racemase family protein [Candidatus Persebacteraceae bacterium AB1(2)]
MHLKIINPNTTVAMTEGIAKAARAVAAQGAEIESCNPSDGPPSIEGWYDDAIAAAAVMETIRADDGRADAIIIACFGDPGLQAAKEATTRPVVGIAQAAMTMAALIADGFSIVTTLARTIPISNHLVRAYGMEHYCRAVIAADIPVLMLEEEPQKCYQLIEAECRQTLEKDRAGAIVLGCAGMSDTARRLTDSLGVPVLDGVACAVKLCESLVGLRLSTSAASYPQPLAKTYAGKFSSLSPK